MTQKVLHHYCHTAQEAMDWLESLIGSDVNGTVDDIAHFVIIKNGVHVEDTCMCYLIIAVVEL